MPRSIWVGTNASNRSSGSGKCSTGVPLPKTCIWESSSAGSWRREFFRSAVTISRRSNHVKLSFGYNLKVGDNVVVHRHVLLDDRGGISLGDGVSVSDFASVYSHSHDVVEGREITTPVTRIDAGVRVTYHATVMSGVHLAEGSMLGSFAVATKDTEPHAIYAGIPANKIKDKPVASRKPPTLDPLADTGV